MYFRYLTIIVAACVGTAAIAECPAKAPKLSNHGINLSANDIPVNAAWMETNVRGKKMSFEDGGTETYNKDGTYFYTNGQQRYDADNIKFYNNGFRCIDYPAGVRFDFYVYNDGQLFSLGNQGERYLATLRN